MTVNDVQFGREVLSSTENDDPNNPNRIPSPFPLPEGGSILDPKHDVKSGR